MGSAPRSSRTIRNGSRSARPHGSSAMLWPRSSRPSRLRLIRFTITVLLVLLLVLAANYGHAPIARTDQADHRLDVIGLRKEIHRLHRGQSVPEGDQLLQIPGEGGRIA